MKRILITGGTGFLGHALIKRLYNSQDHIRVIARNEGKLIQLKQQYPEIEIITGDVADECTVRKALDQVATVYHLAAFKHVGLAETQPYQCAQSNITGTINLLKHFKGTVFVAISTDKAAKLQGVYGASKRIMERLIEERALVDRSVRYILPRYGNVIGSTGSVITKWSQICKEHGEMVITERLATRFFFTVDDAVDLIFEAMDQADSGKPYIKPMKACSVGQLATACIKKYGEPSIVKTIGLQEGENLHETLSDDITSDKAERYTIKELMEMI